MQKNKIDKVKETISSATETAKEKAKQVDTFVKKKPYKAIGIAAGTAAAIGTVVGWLLGRKKKKNKEND